jgi:hypothetical protein
MISLMVVWPILEVVDPRDQLRIAGKRLTDPAEALAQRVAARVVDLVVEVVDVNALALRLDLDAILKHVDVNALISRIDVDALLARVDVNDLVQRLDIDELVEQTDVGAVIARSSGGVATEALDSARSQAVGMDQFIDRWVQRAFRRKRPGPAKPGMPDSRVPLAGPDGHVPSPLVPGQAQR